MHSLESVQNEVILVPTKTPAMVQHDQYWQSLLGPTWVNPAKVVLPTSPPMQLIGPPKAQDGTTGDRWVGGRGDGVGWRRERSVD
jgi:hypothetical protein